MNIITLIASHIDCRKRLQNFGKLLVSINKQLDYFDDMDVRISLSHDKSIDREEILFMINSVNTNGYLFNFCDNKLSQFEHYKLLVQSLSLDDDEDNTWILFSDDDDEWAENRLAAYHHMIMQIPLNEYHKTTCICYTNDTTKNATTFIGSYVDYGIKLKYLKIFFANATIQQLQHKFCDCYLVKFMCTYGRGDLKRAFCATEDILYNWIQHKDNYGTPEKLTFEESLRNNLDLYLAQYSNPTAAEWYRFCDAYTNGKIMNGEVPHDIKRFIIKLYLDNYKDNIFNQDGN